MVHMNHEPPWPEKIAKHVLMDQLARGNVVACLEALEEEWEPNEYKNEKLRKGKPVARQAAKEAWRKDQGLESQAVFQGAIYW